MAQEGSQAPRLAFLCHRKKMIKRIKLTSLLLCLSIGLLTGCRKCYNCQVITVQMLCYKGADSIYQSFAGYRPYLDSLTYYKQGGYTCDSGTSPPFPFDFCKPSQFDQYLGDPFWKCTSNLEWK